MENEEEVKLEEEQEQKKKSWRGESLNGQEGRGSWEEEINLK